MVEGDRAAQREISIHLRLCWANVRCARWDYGRPSYGRCVVLVRGVHPLEVLTVRTSQRVPSMRRYRMVLC